MTIKARRRLGLPPLNVSQVIADYKNNLPFAEIYKRHNVGSATVYAILKDHEINDKHRNHRRKRNVTSLLLFCFETMPELTAKQINGITRINYNYIRFKAAEFGYLTNKSKRPASKELFDATPYKTAINNFLENLNTSQNNNSAFRSDNRRSTVVHL